MKIKLRPAWGPRFASIGLGLLGLSALASCSDWERDKPQQTKAEVDILTEPPPVSPRQQTIRMLAGRINSYHNYDSLGVSHPRVGRSVVSFRRRWFEFATAAENRADINRMLDSLRATGPLLMDRSSDDRQTDTLPYLGPHVSTKSGPAN